VPGSRKPFSYALLRLVPRLDRGERLNVGIVLFCRQHGAFLSLRSAVDEDRIPVLSPNLDLNDVRAQLHALELVAAGDPAGGPVALLDPSERFGWLVAPSSTIIQPSGVHTGLSADPNAEIGQLFVKLVTAPTV
jgi:hypothetical protein